MPVVPATRRLRQENRLYLAGGGCSERSEIAPLHSSLDERRDSISKKEKCKRRKRETGRGDVRAGERREGEKHKKHKLA